MFLDVDGEAIMQDVGGEGLLIKTRTIPKEELYEILISDFYKLVNTRFLAGNVNFCGTKGVFVKEKDLTKFFSLDDFED